MTVQERIAAAKKDKKIQTSSYTAEENTASKTLQERIAAAKNDTTSKIGTTNTATKVTSDSNYMDRVLASVNADTDYQSIVNGAGAKKKSSYQHTPESVARDVALRTYDRKKQRVESQLSDVNRRLSELGATGQERVPGRVYPESYDEAVTIEDKAKAGYGKHLTERATALRRQSGELDDLYNALTSQGSYDYYKSLMQNGDWDKAKYVPGEQTTSGLYEDSDYEIINGNEDALTKRTAFNANAMGMDSSYYLTKLSTEEKMIYNYLYNTGDKDGAKRFIESIKPTLTARANAGYTAAIENLVDADKEKYGDFLGGLEASVASTAMAKLKGASYLGQIADYIDDGKIDENAAYQRFTTTPNIMREAVVRNAGKVGKFLYNTGMSMADFLSSAAIAGGGDASLFIMGSGAAADATIEAKQRGIGDGAALALGTIAGFAEYITEKVSLETLLDKDSWSRGIIGNIVKNTLAEGSEEVASDLINAVADVLIAGDKNQWAVDIQQYKLDHPGATDKDAFNAVFREHLLQVGLDFLGGAISGFGLAGAVGTVNSIGYASSGSAYKSLGSDALQRLIDKGLEYENTANTARRVANNPGSVNVGRLLEGVRGNMSIDSVRSYATQLLEQYGETKNADYVAAAVAKKVMGEPLTAAEQNAFDGSQYGKTVLGEMTEQNLMENTDVYDPMVYMQLAGIADDNTATVREDRTVEQESEDAGQLRDTTEMMSEGEASPSATTPVTTKNIKQIAKDPERLSELGIDTNGKTASQIRAEVREKLAADSAEVKTESAEDTTAEETVTENVRQQLKQNAKQYGDQAQAYVRAYMPGQDVTQYDAGYSIAHTIGAEGGTYEAVRRQSSAQNLTETQRRIAWEAGRTARQNNSNDSTDVTEVQAKRRIGSGTVRYAGDVKSLNKAQRNQVRIIRRFAEATGVNVVLFNSKTDRMGTYIQEEGRYERNTNTIYVDVNSGLGNVLQRNELSRYTLLRTFTHEYVHSFERNSKSYTELRDAVFSTINANTERGYAGYASASEYLIQQKLELYQEKVRADFTPEEAELEVVADALTDILPQSKLLETLYNQNQTVFQNVLQRLKQYIADIKQYLDTVTVNNKEEAAALKEDGKYAQSIVDLFDKVALEAAGAEQQSGDEIMSRMPVRDTQYTIREDREMEARNIRDGNAAVNKLIADADTSDAPESLVVRNAMYRSDIGYIDFLWGTPGRGKKFKKGYGLSHIIAKRNAENGNGVEVAYKMVMVIAKSTQAEIQSNDFTAKDSERLRLFYEGGVAVLSKSSAGNKWLLTGWYENTEAVTYASGEVRDSSTATTAKPIHTRLDGVDATASGKSVSQNAEAGQEKFSVRDAEYIELAKDPEKNRENRTFSDASTGEYAQYMARAQSGRSIEIKTMENNRFERLRKFGDNLPEVWYANTWDYLYVYRNETYTDYEIIDKIPLTQTDEAARTEEAIKNGAYRGSVTVDGWAKTVRSRRQSNSWNHVNAERTGTAVQYDGLYGREQERNDIGSAEEGSGVEEGSGAVGVSEYQIRTSTLSDRDVLRMAAESVNTKKFTEAEKAALHIIKARLNKLDAADAKRAELLAQRRELLDGRQPRELQGEERDTLTKLNNNLRTVNEQRKRFNSELLDVEQKSVAKSTLIKARAVVEADTQRRVTEDVDARIAAVKARGESRLEKEKAKAAERLSEEKKRSKQKLQEQKEDQREKERKKKYRDRIDKAVNSLYRMLNENSNKYHIVQPLRKPVSELLATVDFSSKSLLTKNKGTKADEQFWKKFVSLYNVLSDNSTGNYMVDSIAVNISNENISNVKKLINDRLDSGETSTINTMTGDQLRVLAHYLENVVHAVNAANKTAANAHFGSIDELGRATISEASKRNGHSRLSTTNVGKFLTWKNVVPYYAFSRFGEAGRSIFEAFSKGAERLAFNKQEILDFVDGLYTQKDVTRWRKSVHDIELHDGSRLKMTTAQIMELSQLLERAQARQHIYGKGIKISRIDGKIGSTGDAAYHKVTPDDMANILKILDNDAKAKEVSAKMRVFMARTGAKWGNDISMERFGYEFFREGDTYYPIKSDKAQFDTKDSDVPKNASIYRLLNIGPTKPLNEWADNVIVVGDIFNTFAEHMNDMANLNAYALPLLDCIRWLNYRDGDVNLKNVLEQSFGEEAQSYVTTLLRDINNADRSQIRSNLVGWMFGNMKSSAVGNSLRVAFVQVSSYPRALLKLKGRYLAASLLPHRIGKDYKEMLANSGTALNKSQGGYGMGNAKRIADEIAKSENVLSTLRDWSMKPAEFFDSVTWANLWRAARMQTEAKLKKQGEYTREELMKQTADLFRETVYSSQVMDSVLTRSQIMRGSDTWDKMSSAFMAEPTLSYNILLDSVWKMDDDKRKGNDAWKKNRGTLARAFTAYAVTAAAAAIIESAVDAMRDDDDYESFLQKYWQALFGDGKILDGNLVQDVSLGGKIPELKTIIDLIRGIGGDDMRYQGVVKIAKATRVWIETYKLAAGELNSPTKLTYYGNMTTWGKIYLSLQGLSGLSGLAVSNLTRDVTGLWNTIIAPMAPSLKIKTYDAGATATIRESYTKGSLTFTEGVDKLMETGEYESEDDAYWAMRTADGSGKYSGLRDAITADSTEDYNAAMEELTTHGVKENTALSNARSIIGEMYRGTEDEPAPIDYDTAVDLLIKYGGHNRADATRTVNSWKNKVDNGIYANEIGTSLRDGDITQDEAEKMWVEYGGYTAVEAHVKARAIILEDKYPDWSGITTALNKYQKYASKAFKEDTYMDIMYKLDQYEGEDRKESIVSYIDSHNFTTAQKDALYLSYYKETTLEDTPWH